MNKSELIDKIANDAGITKAAAKIALESFLEGVRDTLKVGGKVTLTGFGSFQVSTRAAREGRNPQTGKPMRISAKNVVKFRPGNTLNSDGGTIGGGARIVRKGNPRKGGQTSSNE